MKLSFPNCATKEEKKVFSSLPCLGEISDKDFPYNDPNIEPKSELRFCTRIFLINDDKICVEYSRKYGYIQILGGHIEDGESLEQATRRETIEESGYEIDELKPIGYFIENGITKRHISFIYIAKPGKRVGTDYDEDEIECEFEPKWYSVNDAMRILAVADKEIIKSYNGRFATKRDLITIKYIKKIL
ncbi:NUDIX hydrolase [Candidatus Saccharibacteria bacterium]|nr:NUDIX hydrolase [Candidatus Saccharibacteria bacterium]